MVHLSKKSLYQQKYLKLNKLFYDIVRASNDENIFFEIIKDIVSPKEQLMIAKRIAIVYLLIKKLEQTEIAEYLSVSRSTVAKFSLLFYERESQFVIIIKKILMKKKALNVVENIFADLFIQPGLKKGHWDLQWKHQQRLGEQKMIDV